MSGHQISVAVDDLSPVVDGAAQTRALTHVEHGGSELLYVLAEGGVGGGGRVIDEWRGRGGAVQEIAGNE